MSVSLDYLAWECRIFPSSVHKSLVQQSAVSGSAINHCNAEWLPSEYQERSCYAQVTILVYLDFPTFGITPNDVIGYLLPSEVVGV